MAGERAEEERRVTAGRDRSDQQRALYGEPVRDLIAHVVAGLGINQAAIARVLGLSPAMLSQLINGQRLKIGNPAVVARLQSLLELAEQAPELAQQEIRRRMDEIATAHATVLTAHSARPSTSRQAETVSAVLRAVASGRELAAAADALDAIAPGLAEVVRVYGSGSAAEAEQHLASIQQLL